MNSDHVPATEVIHDERIQNPQEAEIAGLIVEALCVSGVPEDSIGVISVYRSQLRLLTSKLKHRPGIEVLTADKSQGRDKDCVIVSLVRSNANKAVGDLLRDWRRLNVSFTRAKSKLIIIGSRQTLETINVLNAFLNVLDKNHWTYELPVDSTQKYYKYPPDIASLMSASQKRTFESSGMSNSPTSNRVKKTFYNTPTRNKLTASSGVLGDVLSDLNLNFENKKNSIR